MRSLIGGRGAQGLLGALMDAPGRQQQYMGTLGALAQMDAYGAAAARNREQAAIFGDMRTARERLPVSLQGVALPAGMTHEALADMARVNEAVNWEQLGQFQTGLQQRALRDEAMAAYRAGRPEAGYQTLAVLYGRPPTQFEFGDWGVGDQASGAMRMSPALQALASMRFAQGQAAQAAAAANRFTTVPHGATLVDVGGAAPRAWDTRPVPSPEVLALEAGVTVPEVLQHYAAARGLGGVRQMPQVPQWQLPDWGGIDHFAPPPADVMDPARGGHLRAAIDRFYADDGVRPTALMQDMALYQRVMGMSAQDALRLADGKLRPITDPVRGGVLIMDMVTLKPIAKVDPMTGAVVELEPEDLVGFGGAHPAADPAAPGMTTPDPALPIGEGEFWFNPATRRIEQMVR